jgi:transposase
MRKRYIVDLTAAERAELRSVIRKGIASARRLTRARVLLLADEGETDARIAAALHVHETTIERIRQRFVAGGVERALRDQPRPGGRPKLDGKQEAFLIALACSAPPGGRACWTMPLLADRLVALEIVDAISDETVRRMLKKERPQTLAQEALVHCGGRCRFRLAHGRRARSLRSALRSSASGDLLR